MHVLCLSLTFNLFFSLSQKNYSINYNATEYNESTPNLEPHNFDVTCLQYTGGYEIRDLNNNKSYFGQTSKLAARFQHHFHNLKNGCHENALLREAYAKAKDQTFFQFLCFVFWA